MFEVEGGVDGVKEVIEREVGKLKGAGVSV